MWPENQLRELLDWQGGGVPNKHEVLSLNPSTAKKKKKKKKEI
jgi:hypothetical protein